MRRVKLQFAGREVEFVDREVALRQFEELAEKGTWWPLVVYGPEGCGKSALLKQAVEVLREKGYSVTYISPREGGGEVAVHRGPQGLRQGDSKRGREEAPQPP